ncbi:uncharacterized protein EKO05_0002605 [Ascochyta rabiei]|uniref:Uncharacterized protein n=1 Tax=Didymella rabiei TaxID=5454 RepID=A0A163IHH0_DIDRA|nr:uncharacterized protein EKO05_0002605 [Ascochyta rabiei]KZM25766.1 hypothetical protein ST47_g3035 [Ascochyta rabiei]UPX12028.1 hypothetical protein EKO05_0002605 [Ascochyta rabiei]
MSQPDYLSYFPQTPKDDRRRTWPARPPITESKSSIAMREVIAPWAEMPATPPSCRTVSFSRWSRFTTSGCSTPTGELKASKLCANYGTSPAYNPPAKEWTYLGAEQPLRCGKPEAHRSRHHRQQNSQQSSGTCPSLSSTASTTVSSSSQTEPMDFRRRDFKRASTSSQLTESFKPSSAKGGQEQPPGMLGLIAKLGLDALDCQELPSAFDSEDEDDIDMEDLRSGALVAGSKGGLGRPQQGDRMKR